MITELWTLLTVGALLCGGQDWSSASGLMVLALLVCGWLLASTGDSKGGRELGLPPASMLNSDPAFDYSVIAAANEEHCRNSVASIVQLADGNLMVVYDDYLKEDQRPAHDFFESKVAARISRDGGKNWGEIRYLADKKPGDATVQAPGLLRLQSGDLLLTYLHALERNRLQTGEDWDPGITTTTMSVCRSRDDGKSFVEEAPIWERSPELWFQGGTPWNLQLQSGRILVPIQAAERQYGSHYRALCFHSDDDGDTWQRSQNSVQLPDRGAMEPSVAELEDGSLVMSVRNELGKVHLARSTDGGTMWSKAEPTNLDHIPSPTRLVRIPASNDLLLVYNNSKVAKVRTPLTAAIWQDAGHTWRIVGDIVKGHDIEVGVADVFFPVDDKVLVVFSWTTPPWARERIPLCAVIFNREWLYRATVA